MRRLPSEPLYVSRNHLEGSLCDAPIDRVLAACKKHLVTGVVRVHIGRYDGVLELRAGAVDSAQLGEVVGDAALDAIRAAPDGWYEVVQRLPDLTGDLAATASLTGDVEGVPLIALMRHCEDNVLTCTITVVSGFDRACIDYRAGEIARIEMNGFFDDDALTQVLTWPDARFRVAALPLDLDIEGWPVTRRAPTVPAEVTTPQAPRTGEIIVRPPRLPSGTGTQRAMTPVPLTDDLLLDATPEPPPTSRAPTSPALPARARRYQTGDTLRLRGGEKLRRRARTPGVRSTVAADVLWLVVAAFVLVAIGITTLMLLA